MVRENPKHAEFNDEALYAERRLVVHNDDVNTFDFVIETLMDVCNHEQHQAEQCTLIIHYNGKCVVRKGEYAFLKPMRDAILDRGINATID
ncbi:MAG TPA: Clp protease ClpS [Bacteroidales bacterium]|nr:Clp protease ClpS [Bacteroidales bacterium]